MKFYIWAFFEILWRKLKFNWNRTRKNGTLHEDNIRLWSYLSQFFYEWKAFQTKVVEKLETCISCSKPSYNSGVTVDGISWSMGEHKGILLWLHIMFLRASCFLVLHCLQRLLVVLTGKCFPTFRRRTFSGTPLTPVLFFVRNSGLPLLFIWPPTFSCLTRASRNTWSLWPPLLQFRFIKLFTIARSMRK